MKRNIALTIILVLAMVLTACAQAAPSTAPEAGPVSLKVGMANFSQCCPYFIGMNDAVLVEAKAYYNVTVISTDADGDAAKFQSDIEDLIAQGIDGIIVSGAWLEEAPAALDALQSAGIPTVPSGTCSPPSPEACCLHRLEVGRRIAVRKSCPRFLRNQGLATRQLTGKRF